MRLPELYLNSPIFSLYITSLEEKIAERRNQMMKWQTWSGGMDTLAPPMNIYIPMHGS